MTDERWKECKHHHHGCACREHIWELKVLILQDRLDACEKAKEALQAEVERLGKRIHAEGECLTVMGSLRREAYDELIRETDRQVIEMLQKKEKP